MSAIDKIKDHYNSLSKGESRYFEEWDLTFYKEPINLEKKGRLLNKQEMKIANLYWNKYGRY